ncbi:MAG: hypothetical protein LBL45_01380 [Treponema sp.]|nr:hypothetical protein [Treponema sp.]
MDIRPHEAAEIRIDYRCVETGGRAKPQATYKGLALYWKVLEDGEAVQELEALQLSRLITRNPHIARFDNGLRGGGRRFRRQRKDRVALAWRPSFRKGNGAPLPRTGRKEADGSAVSVRLRDGKQLPLVFDVVCRITSLQF